MILFDFIFVECNRKAECPAPELFPNEIPYDFEAALRYFGINGSFIQIVHIVQLHRELHPSNIENNPTEDIIVLKKKRNLYISRWFGFHPGLRRIGIEGRAQ